MFEAKATSSIETARSAVQTARAAAEQAVRDENFGPYLAVTAADADSDANTAQDHFASIQPPDAASDRLRAATLRLLTRAVDVVERARIALRRGDVAALRELIPELAAAATAMEGFVEQHG